MNDVALKNAAGVRLCLTVCKRSAAYGQRNTKIEPRSGEIIPYEQHLIISPHAGLMRTLYSSSVSCASALRLHTVMHISPLRCF